MFYKLELICHHPPHQCRCRHNIGTEVDRDDLTQNLIKCNPALLKYLGRTSTTSNALLTQPVQTQQQERTSPKANEPYRSIVQEKGLNFILRDNFVSQPNTQPPKLTSPKQQPPQPSPQQFNQQLPHPDPITSKQPTSPKAPKAIPSVRQKQIKNLHKDMKNQSRYLSNTAFRKYFDRQCFQNYGNQNVHQKADGFVYGNYLKTYNINPHTGHNLPNNQETFYHALVTASPEKYVQTQEIRLAQTGKTHIQVEKPLVDKSSLERDPINVDKMLEDNQKHSRIQKKYQHIKLKSKVSKETKKNPANGVKSQGKPVISPNPQANYSPFSPKHQLPLQSRNHLPHPQQVQPLRSVQQSQFENVKSQLSGFRAGSRAQSIVQAVQPSIAPQKATPHCSHRPNQQTTDCECCLNQMKGLILSMADSDPDLASRIVASAKKATLYKNFGLNNYEQAGMNPHNYSSSGKLNIYQPL